MEILEKIKILDRLKREIIELKGEAQAQGVIISLDCDCFLSSVYYTLCFLYEDSDEPSYKSRRIDLWELLRENDFNLQETFRAFRNNVKSFSRVLKTIKDADNA